MKKGYVFVMLSLMLFAVAVVIAVEYCPVDGTTSPTECVCGHFPDSTKGYGQIIIGGASPTVISCNNTADGICVEDFQDLNTGIVGNCSRCADPDCTVGNLTGNGYVWGYVKDTAGRPIYDAVVTGQPIAYNANVNLFRYSPPTDFLGKYNFSGFITGSYQFTASKASYTTNGPANPVPIIRGGITRIDFVLDNGTCSADCTNSNNVCDASCDGKTFNGSDVICKFDTTYGNIAKTKCDGKAKGYPVIVQQIDDTNAMWVRCCEGAPYLDYHAKVRSNETGAKGIKNLVTQDKIGGYNDMPTRVVIAYWQETPSKLIE